VLLLNSPHNPTGKVFSRAEMLELAAIASETGAPPGALAVVTGGPPSGQAAGAQRLLEHPHVAKLSLTGSERAGGAALRASAEMLRPTSLELGGKGALLVFDDADLDAAIEWALLGIFSNAGQICSATSRLLIHRPIATRFEAALIDAVARCCVVGDPLSEETRLGPLISAERQASVLASIDAARADGAALLCGGGPAQVPGLDGGWYVQPTILSDVRLDSAAWRDELFGPVLVVGTFETEAEAIAQANDSAYGLAHAVLSADLERCARVADALDAGTVWVNCNQLVLPATPFGGWKRSGFGREYGEAGIEEYLRYKTVTSTPSGFSCAYYRKDGNAAAPSPT
jgi:betaine-aldehyde dehydrogenase